MTRHTADDFRQHLTESFDFNACLKCEKIIQTESEQRLHLVEKHGVYSSHVTMHLEEIIRNGNKAKRKSSPDFEEEPVDQIEEDTEQDIQEASIDLWDEELELSDDELFTESDQNYTKITKAKLVDMN